MSNRKSSMNSITGVMIAASKFRRLSLNKRQEEGWIQRPLLHERDVTRKRRTIGDPSEIVRECNNLLTNEPTHGIRGVSKFRSTAKSTVFVLKRRRSDTFLIKDGMFDNNRRRGTIHGNHGGQAKRRSADFVMREGKYSSLLVAAKKTEEKRKKLIRRFKIIARSVGYMSHLCQRVIRDNEFSLTYRPEMKRLTELEAISDGQVPCVNRIDISYYKANTQMRMSQEGKRILSKLPKDRTEKEIQYATIALRNVKTISDYPLHIQQQFAKYGYFECYESKRVVVKEGRPSENYYILLYGQVMFAKIDEANMAKKLGSLYRGYYFGELGIYNGTPRQSSIITEEYTELLRISDVDFKNIFMGGDLSSNPEKDSFLKNVIYLKGWPLHVLKGHTKAVMTSYFQRDAIMTRDSNLSEWIFIVKSGSIRVMKKLVKTHANTSKKTGKYKQMAHTDGYSAFMSNENEYQRFTLYNDIDTPPPLRIDGDTEQTGSDENRETPLTLPLMLKLQRACRPHTAKPDLGSTKGRPCRRLSLSWSNGYERPHKYKQPSKSRSTPEQSQSNPSTSRSDSDNNSQVEDSKDKGRRTIFDDWDAATKHKKEELTEADRNPQFVQVQTLTKGQVFGLQYILYKGHPQPSFIVISNGAECVKIHRRMFEEHMNFTIKSELLTKVPPYPTDEYLQNRLVTRMNWECYKDVLLHNLIVERDYQNPDKYGPKYPRIKLK